MNEEMVIQEQEENVASKLIAMGTEKIIGRNEGQDDYWMKVVEESIRKSLVHIFDTYQCRTSQEAFLKLYAAIESKDKKNIVVEINSNLGNNSKQTIYDIMHSILLNGIKKSVLYV